jgi:hypothetical protein
MEADKSRNKQFITLLAFVFRRRFLATGGRGFRWMGRRRFDEVHEGVVEEHCVASGTVDDAVEDVGYDFALKVELGKKKHVEQ